jgi:hypothetical protein
VKSSEGLVMQIVQNHRVLNRTTAELTDGNSGGVSTSQRNRDMDSAQMAQLESLHKSSPKWVGQPKNAGKVLSPQTHDCL